MSEVFRFGAYESCGKCTPCRQGTPVLVEAFKGLAQGRRIDRRHYAALIEVLAATSLCGHGRGLAEFAKRSNGTMPRSWRRASPDHQWEASTQVAPGTL